jgi:outer membrane receptor protein involved in Fe transport
MKRSLKNRLNYSSGLPTLVLLSAACALGTGVSSAAADTAETAARPISTLTATAVAAAQSSSASPSTEVEQIVVTARLHEENVQAVPETIVAVTPKVLQNNEITNFYQLQGFAPSLDVYTGWSRDFTTVLIRGFTASQYVSEVPGLPGPLYDMSNVQILYGPQGTLFGYQALGGAVLYTPSHPEMNNIGASVDLTVGNLNTTNIQGYVNIPLVEDRLAARISFARNHTDGYIRVQGTSDALDSNDNESVRLALQYDAPGGKFTNYAMLQLTYQNNTETAENVTFYDTLGAYSSFTGKTPTGIQQPGVLSAPGGPTYGPYGFPFIFAGDCTAKFLAQIWTPGTTAAQCEQQHANVLLNFQAQALAALALTQASRGYASPPPIENAPITDPAHTYILEDIANWDAFKWDGAFGGGDITFHNVADITWFNNVVTNFTAGAFDYYGSPDANGAFGTKLILPTPMTTLSPGMTTNPTNGFGPPQEAGFNTVFHDEFQIHGTLDTALGPTPGLTWVVGFYNLIAPSSPASGFATNQNIPVSFNGAYNVNEGPAPSYYYPNKFEADNFGQYINAIFDAGALYKPLMGLQFTGGIRFNENTIHYSYYNYSTDYSTPNVFYQTTPCAPTSCSQPAAQVTPIYRNNTTNWSLAVNYLTANNNAYFNASYIVVPGFANNALPAGVTSADVPGWVATAKPENLYDYEIGDKYHFNVNGIRGYVDIDLYHESFSNVQIGETVYVPSTQNYVTYTGNPANEIKEGLEFQGEIFPIENLDIYANLSYAHNWYTSYLASDPTSYFSATNGYVGSYTVGGTNSPLCVPSASLATIPAANRNVPGTVGTCIMDFKTTPIPFAPNLQASLRIAYTLPLKGDAGELVGYLTANYTSAQLLTGGYTHVPVLREEELFGPGVRAAESAPAHTLVNLRLQWNHPFGHDNLTAAAYATNLGDLRYATGSLDFLTATGVATEDFAPPRQFGFEISARW